MLPFRCSPPLPSMPSNPQQAPVLEILKKLKRKLPRAYVEASLASLLQRYSTGLSLSVACDEILAEYQSQRQTEEYRTHYRVVITQVTSQPPEIWLIQLTDGRYAAFYAHSKLLSRFQPGVFFSLPSDTLNLPSHDDIQAEALALARMALSSSTSSKASSGRENAHSPKDIAKLNRNLEEHSSPPSKRSSSLLPGFSALVFPTPTVVIDLDSVPMNTLNLPEPIERFTLQRVWDERSLLPRFIFARVVEISLERKHIRIQDQSLDISNTQPSVLWLLHEHQLPYTHMIENGGFVLLERPAVQPNGDSFFVIANECTTCFHRSFASVTKMGPRPVPIGAVVVPESPPRKRQRRDPDPSELPSAL